MANDVTIVVEASLGDTLLKLELAKIAVNDLEDAGGSAGDTLGNDSNRNSFSSRVGNLQNKLSNLGDRGPLGMVTRAFGNLASAMLEPIQLGAQFAEQFQQVGQVGQAAIATFSSMGIALAALAVIIFTSVTAVEVLVSTVGTLVAIFADFVAPLTLVVGLLGALGIGFGLAAKRAADGGGKLSAFSKTLDTLKSMFSRTSDILAHVFLPYLMELAHAGEKALFFLDKVAKLPLKDAFQKLATQGVPMLQKFINRVAEILAHPIRVAFKLAFGTGPSDNEFASAVASWWHRLSDFLFGYVDRHPLTKLDILKGSKPTVKSVDGIFQPLIEWFDRHHFTRQGIQIGQQILRGILNSGMRHRIVDFMVEVFKDAMRRAAAATIPLLVLMLSSMRQKVNQWGQQLDDIVKNKLGDAFDWVKNKAVSVFNSIGSTIEGIWNRIVSFIENPISININWPSAPSWLSKIPGSSILSDIGGAVGIGSVAGVGHATPRAMGSVVVHQTVHIHGADLSDAPTRRRIAQQLGKAIANDWRTRAAGH